MSFSPGDNINFSLPSHWRWSLLDDIKAEEKRAIISGPFGSNISSKYFVDSGIPVIRGNNLSLSLERFIDDGFVFITEEKANELNTWAEKDDILFTAAGTIGQVGIIGEETKYEKYIISNKQIRVRVNKEKIRPLFAYYWLASSLMIEYIQQRNTGSTIPLVNLSIIKSLPIPVPPIPEQDEILKVASSLDDKISVNRQINEVLEDLAQNFYTEWFVENREAKNWKEIPLPEAIDFLEGPGIRNWQYTNSDEGIRFINIRCIQNKDINIKIANRINSDDVSEKYQHFLLERDDVVVSTSGTLGRFAIVRDEHLPLLLNTSVIRMRPRKNTSTWSYLIGYIGSEEFQFELESRATGSVQKNFGPMHLKQIKIKIPPYELLTEFESVVEPIYRKFLQNLSECQDLEKLRDTLLPKLMKGEIKL